MARTALVVGAGAGGLTAALRLLRNGWQVTVLEKNAKPGGRLGRMEGNGYSFDLGPTIVLMPDVFERLFADLGRDLRDYLDMQLLDPNYRLHFADGSHLDSTSHLQKMLTELDRFAPGEAAGYMRYLSDLYRRYRIARYDFIEQPMLSMRELFDLRKVVKLLKLRTLGPMYADIGRFIRDERLKLALTFQSLYIGIDPYQAPAIYNVIGFMEVSYSGVWYCKGGYHAVTDALCKVLEEMGGALRTRAEVAEVLCEGGRATGVRLATGEALYADVVIVNADVAQAATKLLPEVARREFPEAKMARQEQSCSAFMMYLGVRRKYPHAHVHNVFFSRDFRKNVDQIFHHRGLPEDPSFYVHVPSSIDPAVAPEGREAVYVLVPVPNLSAGIDWEIGKKVLRERVLNRLEKEGFVGIKDEIEFEAVFTPEAWQAQFALRDGSAFGVMPKLLQSAYWRPSLKSRSLQGLYFVGASTHPGGGIPIVMTGARTLEGIMARDYPGDFPAVDGLPYSRASEAVADAL